MAIYTPLLERFTTIAVGRSLLANNPGMRYFFSCVFIDLNLTEVNQINFFFNCKLSSFRLNIFLHI